MPEKSPTHHSVINFLKINFKYFIISVILLILFYSFSFLVKEDVFKSFDFAATVKTQAKIPVRVDPFFSFLSLIGSFESTFIILIVILIAFRRKISSIFVVGLFCFMHVVEIIGKAFLDHPPTPVMFHRYAFDFGFPSSYVQPGGSYPSGHAMRTTFLAVILIDIILKSKIKLIYKYCLIGIIVLFCITMYVSRVSLGEHWTSDVVGGSMLGAAFAFFSLIFI